MSLYEVTCLSNVPSLSTAVLNAVISLSNLSGLTAIYLYNEGMFCPCCGMQLRLTPSNKEGKDRLIQERRYIIN
jgi:hypothetical protein